MILPAGEVYSSAIAHPGKVRCCFVYLPEYKVCVVRRSLFKCCLWIDSNLGSEQDRSGYLLRIANRITGGGY